MDHLPTEVQAGRDAARRAAIRHSGRLSVEVDGVRFRILRAWAGGFALSAEDAPPRRGLVDIHDGPRHVAQCLIVASGEEDGQIAFEIKRSTDASGGQPVDFLRAAPAPSGLLARD